MLSIDKKLLPCSVPLWRRHGQAERGLRCGQQYVFIAGLVKGYDRPDDDEAKAAHYQLIQKLAYKFKEENGSIICRELLGLAEGADFLCQQKRTESYYADRPCEKLVADAAEIMENYLRELR